MSLLLLHCVGSLIISRAALQVYAFPWHTPFSLWLSTASGPYAALLTPEFLWGKPHFAATTCAAIVALALMIPAFVRPRVLTLCLYAVGYLMWVGFGLVITYGGK